MLKRAREIARANYAEMTRLRNEQKRLFLLFRYNIEGTTIEREKTCRGDVRAHVTLSHICGLSNGTQCLQKVQEIKKALSTHEASQALAGRLPSTAKEKFRIHIYSG